MRAFLFWCIAFLAVGCGWVYAEESKGSLEFYPPFHVVDIAKKVQRKQDTVDVSQFHTMITVQYGTRTDWTNACSWLNEQTERVMRFYVPPQNGSEEYYYFCSIFKTYAEPSVSSLSDLHNLATELTRQFGGTITRWSFAFREGESE